MTRLNIKPYLFVLTGMLIALVLGCKPIISTDDSGDDDDDDDDDMRMCTDDDDCEGDEICDGSFCATPEDECTDDGDCDGDDICDNGACVAPDDGEDNVLVIGGSGDGGTVTTEGGTTLTFGDGSLDTGTTVTVEEVNVDTVESGGQTFDVVAGIEVEIDDTVEEPPVVEVPNDDNLTEDDQILIVEVVELPNGDSGINLVGTATVSADGETIVSNNADDEEMFQGEWGVDESGTYIIIVTDGNQGFTVGQVTDDNGDGVGGATVFSSSGAFVGVTDDGGYFAIPELIGSATLYVSDPETGGYANIYVAVAETPQLVTITLTVPTTVADGLPGGCLDVNELDAYSLKGNTQVVSSLEPIAPLQGGGMVLMTSGDGAEADKTSGMDMTFTVPDGVGSFEFAYRFLTDEYPDYVGTQYNDLFNVIAYTAAGSVLLVEERVNDAEMAASDTEYGGETPWKLVSVNVSDFAGTGTPMTLSFVVSDVADTVYDTAVLIDDLKFDTGDCDGEQTVVVEDADEDGYSTADDCNDDDPAINPGAEEVCDQVDNDCDGDIDEGCSTIIDEDGDTYPPEEDCDDNNSAVYPGAPEACDEIDNDCDGDIDENCVTELPQSHHVDFSSVNGFVSSPMYAIYQRFDETYPVDVDGMTLTFVPNGATTQYTVTASSLMWDSDEGALSTGSATQCDDCYDTQPLDFSFSFYGTAYSEVFIGSNGYLTFGAGDSTFTDSVEHFLASNPRVSAMFDDLDTRGDDTVADDIYVYSDTTKLVVTCRNFQHYSYTGTSNTFQFVIYADGTIRISYNGIEDLTTGAIAGISPGSITTASAK